MATRQPIITLSVCLLVSQPALIHIQVLWVLICPKVCVCVCVWHCDLCVLLSEHLLSFVEEDFRASVWTLLFCVCVCVCVCLRDTEREAGVVTLLRGVPNVFSSDHLPSLALPQSCCFSLMYFPETRSPLIYPEVPPSRWVWYSPRRKA